MAHFAKVVNGKVTEVVVVSNEHEANGEAFLHSLGKWGTWIQTSYNQNFRGKFAVKGDTYNAEKDRFEAPQPWPSWTLNEETVRWEPPVARPEDDTKFWDWNEETQTWDGTPYEQEPAE